MAPLAVVVPSRRIAVAACGGDHLPLRDVREQAELAGPLDRAGELALVATAGARDARGADLALLAHRTPEGAEVLVVDDVDLVSAELAGLAAAAACRSALTLTPAGRCLPATLLCHAKKLPVSLKRNVVVPDAATCGGPLEVAGVGGNVALRHEPAAVLAPIARSEELDGVS